MEMLLFEVNQSIGIIENIILRKNELTEINWQSQLVVENLRAAVTNGRIKNSTLRKLILVTYFRAIEFNQMMQHINSPEYTSAILTGDAQTRYNVIEFTKKTKTQLIQGAEGTGDISYLSQFKYLKQKLEEYITNLTAEIV